jgi:subtilisin-like proprotein convertase family protein
MKLAKLSILSFVIIAFIQNYLVAQTFQGYGGDVPSNGSPIEFSINVSGLSDKIDTTFGLETLCLSAAHTWVADLRVVLKSPDGTEILLIDNIGGDQDSFINTCLNAFATESIYQAAYPFTGTFMPIGQMGNFNNGQNPNGIWKLIVNDTYAFVDDGSILDWSISFGNNPGKPFIFTPNKQPIIKFYTGSQQIQKDIKKTVIMKVIDNGPGQLNYPTDPPNNYDGYANLKFRGNSSFNFPKKPLKVETCDTKGNDSAFSILGLPKESDWVLNATYSDKTLLRNVITHKLFNEMGHYSSRTRFVNLFIDENYQGLYVFMESIKRDKNRVDIAKLKSTDTSGVAVTGGYIIKCDKGDDGGWFSARESFVPGTKAYYQYVYPKAKDVLPQQATYIQSFIDSLEEALYSPTFKNNAGYRYDYYLDLPSFADNFILNELAKNVDGYRLSSYFHKKKITDGGKLHAGPLWDFDLSFRNADYCNGADPQGWMYEQYCSLGESPPPMFFYKMFGDVAFWDEVRCRWDELRSSILTEEYLFNFIDNQRDSLLEAAKMNFTIWPILGVYVWPNPGPLAKTYEDEIDQLKSWIQIRLNWMDANIPMASINCTTKSDAAIDTKNYQILPNPASNEIKIKSNEPVRNLNVELLNVQGIKQLTAISQTSELNINISHLSQGYYFVKIMEGDKFISMEKLLIIR